MEPKKSRLVFIDALRGLAVFAMLECHVVNAIMMNSYKVGELYDFINILNGFIAVSFLFLAGSGFYLAIAKKGQEYLRFEKPLIAYIKRLGLILLLAYSIHLPVLSIFKLFSLSPSQLLVFAECDVLQTIVASSLFGLLLFFIIRNLKYAKYVYALFAVVFFFFTPLMWGWNAFSVLPTMIAAYFSKAPISKFPLFPWSGYFFTGVAFTAFFFSTENKEKLAKIGFISAIIVGYLCFATRFWASAAFNWPDWWQGFPLHSIYRVCGPIMMFCLLYLIENKLKESKIANAFALIGQESLLVYIGHLMLVYGSIINFGYIYMLGPRAHPVSTALVTIIMCVFFYYMALAWNTLKKERPAEAKKMMYGCALMVLAIMCVF
jgi:uncharacterized membrane protein